MAELLNIRQLTDTGEARHASQSAADEVAPGRKVSLHFSLTLPGGELITSNFGKEPAVCVIGDGSLLPGFERTLYGLKAGEEICVEVAPAEAFGFGNEENVQTIPRFRFPPDLPIEKGLMVEFSGSGSYRQAGMVLEFDAMAVKVDFNHPLAGRSIIFRARISGVEAGRE